MLDFGFFNMDCMEGMKEFPDKYFDLAIVDPPYGINIGQNAMEPGICAPGGGNKQNIPFGGKKNPKYSGGGAVKIGGAKPFGKNPRGGSLLLSQNLQGVR